MAKKLSTISGQLRAAILAAPVNRHTIAQETGVHESALSRFVHGTRGLDGSSIDKLGIYLGLELKQSRKPKRED